MSTTQGRGPSQLAGLAGLALVGYGGLVLLGLLAHESVLAAVGSLLLGAVLLLRGAPAGRTVGRPALVAGLGLTATGGTLLYNLVYASGFSTPEWGLIAYGLALAIASRHLHADVGPVSVATFVGWSFPLLLGPLMLFAFDAALTGPAGDGMRSLADPVIATALVEPMALALQWLGTPAETYGTNLVLETADGSLTLGVGLVCAGIYPLILFVGLLALHAWQTRAEPRKACTHFAVGASGLYLFNVVRLVALAEIGQRWGAHRLQEAHAHLGWILYGVFAVLFWIVVVPRLEDAEADPAG